MSNGPAAVGGSTCIEATKRHYINMKFTVEDFCTYKGCCERCDLVFHHNFVCELCKYRKPLDIPEMIRSHKEKEVIT